MHNKDKYPEIFGAKEKAEKTLVSLMKKRQVHTDAMKITQRNIATLNAEKLVQNDLAMADSAQIGELRDQISRYARAMQATVASGS
jgi:hypothetical protein